MSSNTRVMDATPDQVWKVLSDGWLFPLWVVGASRMRSVDDAWPAQGAQIHHSVGAWPLLLDDSTEVLECEPPSRLVLKARAWPAGSLHVHLTLKPLGTQTEVTIEEDAVEGPAKLVPKPARDLQLGWRNVETLRRLAFIAERRQ